MRLSNNEKEETTSIYYREKRGRNPLTNEQERELAIGMENGDETCREKLITANLKFVSCVARKFRNSGVPFSDLVSVGNMALVKAADKFDYRKGVRFISYAVWWVKNAMIDLVNEYRGNHEEDSFDDMFDAEDDSGAFEYMSGLVNEEYEQTIMDSHSRNAAVDDLLSALKERERKILILYFGLHGEDEMTLDEIGDSMNLTMERVRQIKDIALKKVKCAAVSSSEFETYRCIR